MEYLRDPEGVGYQLELAILEYFVHVLLSPLALPHDALDSNHGCSILVPPLAIDGLEFRSLLERSLVPSVYHQWTLSSCILEAALWSVEALVLPLQLHRLG